MKTILCFVLLLTACGASNDNSPRTDRPGYDPQYRPDRPDQPYTPSEPPAPRGGRR